VYTKLQLRIARKAGHEREQEQPESAEHKGVDKEVRVAHTEE
jgi:hypothetical protein